MIIGQKHKWCGNINWNGEKSCTCSDYLHASKNITVPCMNQKVFEFIPIEFDSPVMEKFAKELAKIASRMDMNITIDFCPDFDEEDVDDSDMNNIIPAVSIDGWLYVYPEKIEADTLTGVELFDGFALDVEMIEHNYPNEPDSVNYDRVIEAQSMYTIIKKVLTMIWEQKYDYVTEALYYEEEYANKDSDVV
jgi:hypothetical protein